MNTANRAALRKVQGMAKAFALTTEDGDTIATVRTGEEHGNLQERLETALREHQDCYRVGIHEIRVFTSTMAFELEYAITDDPENELEPIDTEEDLLLIAHGNVTSVY